MIKQIKITEYHIPFYFSRIIYVNVIRIGIHFHHFFSNNICWI